MNSEINFAKCDGCERIILVNHFNERMFGRGNYCSCWVEEDALKPVTWILNN